MLLRAGTGTSRLSLVQTDLVCERLRQANPDLKIERKIISSNQGDQNKLNSFLRKNGIVKKEILNAVQDGRIDFAVLSMRNVTILEDDLNLVIAALPERGSPADVLVSNGDLGLRELEPGSIVGTSSLIRICQLKRVRPDLRPEPIRGSLEARIRKTARGAFDAVILAEAGLARLGITGRISERLLLEGFISGPGQGIIATVARKDNQGTLDLLRRLDHFPTRTEAEAEQELARMLKKECRVPVGAIASVGGDRIQLTARILSADGKECLRVTGPGSIRDPMGLATKVAGELVARGAKGLEGGWRDLYVG